MLRFHLEEFTYESNTVVANTSYTALSIAEGWKPSIVDTNR